MGTEIVQASHTELAGPALASKIAALLAPWHLEPEDAASDAMQSACDGAVAAWESGDAKAVLAALEVPAPEKGTALAIAELLASFIPPKDVNMKIFSRMMVSDVMALKPAALELDAAAAQLRKTCKFLPSIAEVLAALEAQQRHTRARAGLIRALPKRIREMRTAIEWRKEIDARKCA